jgi:TatD DNase family protein
VIDTHAHLDACEEPPDAILERARAAGVDRVVTVGTGIDSSRKALTLAESHDGVFAAVGIDPHQAGSAEAGRVDELRPLLAHPKAVAVGETGLDDFHRHASLEQQQELLRRQLELASEAGMPVVIHSRAAVAQTAHALAGFDGAVVLHCFSEPDLLPVALDRGYYVSFAGNVTFPKADDLRGAAAHVPANRLLAETDSPYLAPQPVRGNRNEPANVVHTVRVLAAVRGEDPDELGELIAANAAVAFGLASTSL